MQGALPWWSAIHRCLSPRLMDLIDVCNAAGADFRTSLANDPSRRHTRHLGSAYRYVVVPALLRNCFGNILFSSSSVKKSSSAFLSASCASLYALLLVLGAAL